MPQPENDHERLTDFYDGARRIDKDVRVPEISCEEFRKFTWGRLKEGVSDPDVSDDLGVQMKSISAGYHAFECQKSKCRLLFQAFNNLYFDRGPVDLERLEKRVRSLED